MKQFILIFSLLFITLIGFSQNTKTIYYDADWNVISNKKNASFYRNIEPYKEDKTHYLVRDFYITGEKQMEAVMSSLEPEINDGFSNFFYKDGKQNTARFYVNGKENGHYKEWFPNGVVEKEGDIKDDQKTGQWKYNYSDGTAKTSGIYTNDEKQGEWTINEIGGKPYLKETYKNGKLVKLDLLHNKGIYYEYYSTFDSTGKSSISPILDYTTDEEYKLTEPYIRKNVQFLETDTKLDDIDLVYGFTLLWLTNCPYLGKFGVYMNKYVLDFPLKIEESYEFKLLMFKLYTIGLGKYSLDNYGNEKDEIKAQVSGTESMIKLYESLKAKNPKATSKKMEKLSELSKQGKLYDFIKNYKQ